MIRSVRNHLGLILVLALSIFSLIPFFQSGLFPIHDDTQVGRILTMREALSNGIFPVRWVKDLGYGYGYPNFNFYAPFPYYIGGLFSLGLDLVTSTKIVMVLPIILSGIGMYLLGREFFGQKAGVIAAIFYIFAPYHAVQVYVRGAVSESFGYALLPFIFFAMHKVYEENSKIYFSILAISYALLILSHNLTAIMVAPFIFILMIIYFFKLRGSDRKDKIITMLLALIVGVLLSAFYWIPSILELKYTNISQVTSGGSYFRDNFVCISQIWNSPWGFGGSIPGCVDGLSFRIGKLHVLASALSGALLVFSLANNRKRTPSREQVVVFMSIVGFIISVFLCLEYSRFIWELFYPMKYFQFPWRFLMLVSFFSSLLAGSVILLLAQTFKKRSNYMILSIFIILLCSSVFFYSKLFKPQTYTKDESLYLGKNYLSWEVSKRSDEYMPPGFSIPKSINEVPNQRFTIESTAGKITKVHESPSESSVRVEVSKDTKLRINFAYFPGLKVFVNGKEEKALNDNKGMLIELHKGVKEVKVKFVETPVEKIANGVSLGGAMALGSVLFWRKRWQK